MQNNVPVGTKYLGLWAWVNVVKLTFVLIPHPPNSFGVGLAPPLKEKD